MDDPRKKRLDSFRIAVMQRHERVYWSRAFGITQNRLREAVKHVGPMVVDVKGWLIKQIEDAEWQ